MKPLRKIVATRPHPTIPGQLVETLDCGHEQRQKSDLYGPTNAYRRRCRQCPSLTTEPDHQQPRHGGSAR